jgi:hypothetical protein
LPRVLLPRVGKQSVSPRLRSTVHHPVIPATHPRARLLQYQCHAPCLDLDFRPAAGGAVAGAGRHQPLQRGDGLPTYVLEETPQANGTILRRGRGKAAGFTLEWEEKPYEWIHGRHFRQARVFTKGPFRRFGPVFDLEPDGAGGSKVSYALDWEPLTLFGARLARQAGEVSSLRSYWAATSKARPATTASLARASASRPRRRLAGLIAGLLSKTARSRPLHESRRVGFLSLVRPERQCGVANAKP